MKVQIIGTRRMDFATDKGQVTGIKLYITGKNPNVIGQIADSVWITPEALSILQPVLSTFQKVQLALSWSMNSLSV